MQRRKLILPLLFLLMIAMILAACGKKADDVNETVREATETVSVTQKAPDTEEETQAPEETRDKETEKTPETQAPETQVPETEKLPDENGSYYSKDDVAEYIKAYGHLPQNFIKKSEANSLGWSGGPLESYAPGKAIGGDRFGNYEGLLPKKKGRTYTECDIDTKGKARGAKRIVFSNDGLIYYTDDHYGSFTLLYGEE